LVPTGVRSQKARYPFVSRKQKRIFVRQNFVPVFDLPLTISALDRPLGTHVFTAIALKDDGAMHRAVVFSPMD
jgi:hypothetical protein